MSLAGQIIDIYDDTSYEGLKKLGAVGAYGDTHILSPEEHKQLSDDNFALIVLTKHGHVLRKFPIHDEGNTWLSTQYFEHTNSRLDGVEKIAAATNLKLACDAYEIVPPPSIVKYASNTHIGNIVNEGERPSWYIEAQNELMKTASAEINARLELPDSAYALILHDEGDVIRKYAMPDANQVKIASEYFKKYAQDLHPEHRHQFALNVIRRAEELNVDLSEANHLQKWASAEYNNKIDWYLEERKALMPRNDEGISTLDKLASLRSAVDPFTFAEALHEFDKAAGLDRYYEKGLSDPWESTIGQNKYAWHAEIDDDVITESDLKKVAASDKLRSHFGETFQKQFAKHAIEVFESLPTPEKVVIKQIAKGEI